ncbi:hypothetical protein AVEN_85636-1 [Araneus ventricosus]|uniref:Uncharacterized protein n=1 Tax=Araneus ventricosus TaxID=182803 RepID=A0A4Y2NU75_ARAVE|nr:hypothetical protein AVEN_85636-1 [Araneus ventricosus]
MSSLVVSHRRPILEGFLSASFVLSLVRFYKIVSGGYLQIWIPKPSRWSLNLSTYQLEFLEEPPPLILGEMPQVDWLSQNPSIHLYSSQRQTEPKRLSMMFVRRMSGA